MRRTNIARGVMLFVVLLCACDVLWGPARLAGEYQLIQVSGSTPPVIIGRDQASASYVALTSGTLSFDSDIIHRTLSFVDVQKFANIDSTVRPNTLTYFGRYRRSGDTLFIAYPPQDVSIGGEDTAIVQGTDVLVVSLRRGLTYEPQRLTYIRK